MTGPRKWCALLLGSMLIGSVIAVAAPTSTVRVFQLKHMSAIEASQIVQPLLSEEGILTLTSNRSRITVQDKPPVVAKVADTLEALDHKPPTYRLRVELLQGLRVNIPPTRQAKVDDRLRKMFPFVSYLRLGEISFEGEFGTAVQARLGDDYRVSFNPQSLVAGHNLPWGMPSPGTRMQLNNLVLEQVEDDGGYLEVVRTRVVISEAQQAFIGAGGSEDSPTGLVLILNAVSVGDS